MSLKEGPADSYTRIRARPSLDGIFSHQLNPNDLLDWTIRILPKDAHALLLLMDHDLYEDEEDDFCCGRAYGGSRVAVVSSARYNPLLYGHEGVNVQHIWPASHCATYVNSQCNMSDGSTQDHQVSEVADGALYKAVAAFKTAPSSTSTKEDPPYGLWLFCPVRTASHELGHCFGLDHCVYYACVMQGTASVAEDCRQPPYLCPVWAKKISRAKAEGHGSGFEEDKTSREACEAITKFCAKWRHTAAWAGYEAWLEMSLHIRS